MRLYVSSLLLLSLFISLAYCQSNDEWEKFKKKHKKVNTRPEFDAFRKNVWKENFIRAQKHNQDFEKGKVDFKIDLNSFSDWTDDEFKMLSTGFVPNDKVSEYIPAEDEELIETKDDNDATTPTVIPAAFDWRTKNAVTPVRNQMTCNSCWAFAAAGALESHNFKKTGKLVEFSEQQLIDCSRSGLFIDRAALVEPKITNIKAFQYTANGCNGGNFNSAFMLAKYNSIKDTRTYPFANKEQTCKFNQSYAYLTTGTTPGFVHVWPRGNETALIQAIFTKGPIAAAIYSSDPTFRTYAGGIYSTPNCMNKPVDHSVLIVGFGTDGPGKDFYIVKNSWGPNWGEGGYFRLARNQNNMCSIASFTSYPLL